MAPWPVLALAIGCRGGDGEPGSLDTSSTPQASAWYEDHDGDGLGGDVSHEAATAEPGWVSSTGDCDDEDPVVLGPSTWYLDGDGDGDGFAGADDTVTACEAPTGAHATADDCDDGDRAVYPGAPPICGDGVANDCDGPADPETGCRFEGAHDVARDRWRWTGSPESYLGLPGLADIDGNGQPELLLAAPNEDPDPTNGWEEGVVYVVASDAPPGPAPKAAVAEWYGVSGDQQVGRGANGVGDLDGDGRDEVLVAAGSEAFLVSSPDTGSHMVESVAVATFPYSTGYDHFTSVPDPDLPGARLLAIGAWEDDWHGRIRIYRGPLAGAITGPDAWMTIEGEGSDETGVSMATVDVDGGGNQGIASVVREHGGQDCGGNRAVFATEALAAGTYAADEVSDAWWHACSAQIDQVDSAGDVNGDGYEDLLVGAQGGPDLPWYGFLFEGPLVGVGTRTAEDAASVTWVAASGTSGGVPVEGGGDLDGDGFDDVVVYATNWDGSTNHFGDLNVFYGPLEGTLDVQADADASFYDERYTRLGEFEMEFVGDLDHDGRDDLLVGATNWGPYPDYHYGAAYLILGGEVF